MSLVSQPEAVQYYGIIDDCSKMAGTPACLERSNAESMFTGCKAVDMSC